MRSCIYLVCGDLALYRLQLPRDLPAYDPRKQVDPSALGDVLMEYGMLDRARVQYAKAGEGGRERLRMLEAMDHQARGGFYLNKARTLRQTIFLKPALDEFAAATDGAKSEAARRAGLAGIEEVRATAMKLASHIWGRLPETKWLVPGHRLP